MGSPWAAVSFHPRSQLLVNHPLHTGFLLPGASNCSRCKDLTLVIPALHSLIHSFIFFIFIFQQERCFSGALQVPHTGSKQQGAQGGMRQGPALCHFTITLVGLWPPLFLPSPLQTCTKLVPAQCLPKGGTVGRTCRVRTTQLLQTTYSLAHPKNLSPHLTS